jgi:hypothetical protein
MTAIASLRHRLTLEAPEDEPDGAGGVVRVWNSLGQVWAAIEPLPRMSYGRRTAVKLSADVVSDGLRKRFARLLVELEPAVRDAVADALAAERARASEREGPDTPLLPLARASTRAAVFKAVARALSRKR